MPKRIYVSKVGGNKGDKMLTKFFCFAIGVFIGMTIICILVAGRED